MSAGIPDDGQHRAPAGLLEKLMAAVRPEFRADVLVFDPADPVFGGKPCRVPGCGRPTRSSGMCYGHYQRWAGAGRPDITDFAASDEAAAPWSWQAPPGGCLVPGCGLGRRQQQLCGSHLSAWKRSGTQDPAQWAAGQPPVSRPDGQDCRIGYCGLQAEPGTVLCFAHGRRWKREGCPDLETFAGECGQPEGKRETADLRMLPAGLRLEMQYALQCRRDDNMVRTRPTTVRTVTRWIAGSGASSLLDRSEAEWRAVSPPGASVHLVAFLAYAHRKVTDLAEGAGWDSEYPRDIWRMRRLGIDSDCATLRFAGISQPWLKDLAKRWARWRLGTGLGAMTCYHGIRALTRLSGFLASAGITSLSGLTREVLERYLADLAPAMAGKEAHHHHIGHIATFLRDIRRHQWDTSLPASAQIFPEDYPHQVKRVPRALAGHIMAQVEQPANLEREENPAYRLITLILIRCGLRISDACKIPADCLAADADGAPYLRYWNRKMKREALVPADDELVSLIARQQERNRERNPGGTPVLFPRPTANIDGTRPLASNTYRAALYDWLQRCDVRDEHGQPVRLKPHQWRHTLGTVLINRDVPQHVVQKILDHDSPAMTAHYARLSDKTVREQWERARKVSAKGEPVQISPGGPLGDAAWAKQQLSRATQALPNGYCQLPLVKTCPHANSCLTCPMFVTTAEFLPQHRAQRQQTLQIITAAEAAGHSRVTEMNKQVADNLDKIITALESEDGDEAAGSAC